MKEDDKVKTDLVTPMAAVKERAKSEYEKEKEKNEPRVKLSKRSIKKKKKRKGFIKRQTYKRSTSKIKKIKQRKGRHSKKRAFNSDYYDNVWNQQQTVKKKQKT